MSKSVIIMLGNPDGQTKDLPNFITTMSPADNYLCPNISTHNIIKSSRYIFCHPCGVYWDRFRQEQSSE